MSAPKPSREDLIYLWKTEGGNLSWARWCHIHDIPEHNEDFIPGLIRAAKINEKKPCTDAHSPVNSGQQNKL